MTVHHLMSIGTRQKSAKLFGIASPTFRRSRHLRVTRQVLAGIRGESLKTPAWIPLLLTSQTTARGPTSFGTKYKQIAKSFGIASPTFDAPDACAPPDKIWEKEVANGQEIMYSFAQYRLLRHMCDFDKYWQAAKGNRQNNCNGFA